jgi:predicted  nucleic acid-binding Zn-ribbon protein
MSDGSLATLWELFNIVRDRTVKTETKVEEIEKSQEKTERRLEKEMKALEKQIKNVEATIVAEVKDLAKEVRASGSVSSDIVEAVQRATGKKSFYDEAKRPQTIIVTLVGAIVILVEVMANMVVTG